MKILALSLMLISLSGCQKEKIKMTKTTSPKQVYPEKVTEKNVKRVAPKGLKTKVITAANNDEKMPKVGNTVKVHYTGWLAQEDGSKGRKIDSSIDRGEPLEFTIGLNQVIKGFEEGALLMKKGEKRLLTISPELGYGEKGVGLFIPPNATLIFEIELVGIA